MRIPTPTGSRHLPHSYWTDILSSLSLSLITYLTHHPLPLYLPFIFVKLLL